MYNFLHQGEGIQIIKKHPILKEVMENFPSSEGNIGRLFCSKVDKMSIWFGCLRQQLAGPRDRFFKGLSCPLGRDYNVRIVVGKRQHQVLSPASICRLYPYDCWIPSSRTFGLPVHSVSIIFHLMILMHCVLDQDPDQNQVGSGLFGSPGSIFLVHKQLPVNVFFSLHNNV